MSHQHRSVPWVLVVAACAACSHNEQEPLVPASRQEPPPVQAQQPQERPEAADPESDETRLSELPGATGDLEAGREVETGREGTLGVSPGIRERCKLPETRAESPQFDFDESELRPRGMNILDGIAACMQEGGALAGQSVTVVGHADPRGTEDYNRGLGMRRADAARRYLESKGIPASRVNVRTRGEAEAKGTDASGWQLDRHVEIEEANSPRR